MYSNSEDLIKSIQLSLPSTKSCNVCCDNFTTMSSQNVQNTRFKDIHLQSKRVLGRILPTNLSSTFLSVEATQWLKPKLNFSFLTCQNHKNKIIEIYFKLCFLKYSKSILTYLHRVFKGKIIPKNRNLSPPVKLDLNYYLKTIKKVNRSKVLDSEK